MENIKGILFDMDGVLVESEPAHASSWLSIINSRGINPKDGQINLENYIGTKDLDVATDLKKIYPERFPETENELVTLKRDYFIHVLTKGHIELESPKGRDLFLSFLKEEGIRLGVVSNCSRREIEATIKNQKIDHYFDFVIGVDEVSFPKPSSIPYETGLERMKLSKEDVLVVEDSFTGVTAARTGKFTTLGMATSHEFIPDYPEVKFYKNFLEIKSLWE